MDSGARALRGGRAHGKMQAFIFSVAFMYRIGIDLGGTKIELVALAGDGEVRLRQRVPTPQGDYAGTLDAIAALVRGAEAEIGGDYTVGIGTPGAPSQSGGRMKNCNSTCLNGQPFQADIEALLQRPVRLANDANCFTLSEAIDGAGKDARAVFGVILGTGVGGGMVLEGRLWQGANHIAGEWGHMPLPLPEASDLPLPGCYCGRHGCVEAYLSGPALQAQYAAQTGLTATPAEIATLAEGNAQCAMAVLETYERRLGRALAQVVNLFDPEVIVLGGGLSNLARLYRTLPEYMAPHVFSDTVLTRIVPPLHGDSSGVRGAAWLWAPVTG
ncbi:fructokinase [Gulbenkiania mobilis]|uniref:Fructokinase n=2 Tax=Gulbenkiania mobilis TaxID=397457 RepID=A0ABY2D1V2_GULMO|nr:fructokinase [Gulbenkiania mobilis]